MMPSLSVGICKTAGAGRRNTCDGSWQLSSRSALWPRNVTTGGPFAPFWRSWESKQTGNHTCADLGTRPRDLVDARRNSPESFRDWAQDRSEFVARSGEANLCQCLGSHVYTTPRAILARSECRAQVSVAESNQTRLCRGCHASRSKKLRVTLRWLAKQRSLPRPKGRPRLEA